MGLQGEWFLDLDITGVVSRFWMIESLGYYNTSMTNSKQMQVSLAYDDLSSKSLRGLDRKSPRRYAYLIAFLEITFINYSIFVRCLRCA